MDINEFFDNLFDFNEYRYFYHITSKGRSDEIMENGLLMQEDDPYKRMIEITPDMIKNPRKFLEDEYSTNLVSREEMVIIRVPIGLGTKFIDKLEDEEGYWMGETSATHLLSSGFVLGYFDLETLEYMPNYNSYGEQVDDYEYTI